MNAQNSGDALSQVTLRPSPQAGVLQIGHFMLLFDEAGYPKILSGGREYRFNTGDIVQIRIPDFPPAEQGFGMVVGFNWDMAIMKPEKLPTEWGRRPIIILFPDGTVAAVSLGDIGEEVVSEVDEQDAQFGEAASTLRWVASSIRNVLLTPSTSQNKTAAKPVKHRWVSTRRGAKPVNELRVA